MVRSACFLKRVREGFMRLKLVRVIYRDHVLFRKADPSVYVPVVRETVGWLWKEDEEALWILWDRSLSSLPHERIRPMESGLVISKADVLEVKELGV
jgi:hypothetical protein